jgi:hypothetical protein
MTASTRPPLPPSPPRDPGGSAVPALPAPIAAQANFDGTWSVLIVTEEGTCDRAYRYPVRISNGSVGYAGEASFNVVRPGRRERRRDRDGVARQPERDAAPAACPLDDGSAAGAPLRRMLRQLDAERRS